MCLGRSVQAAGCRPGADEFTEPFVHHLRSNVEILGDMSLFIVLVTVENDQSFSEPGVPRRDAALRDRYRLYVESVFINVFELDEEWIKGREVIVRLRRY